MKIGTKRKKNWGEFFYFKRNENLNIGESATQRNQNEKKKINK